MKTLELTKLLVESGFSLFAPKQSQSRTDKVLRSGRICESAQNSSLKLADIVLFEMKLNKNALTR